ncbi:MAG: TIGR03984 family CRISPR-associated protein [Desulfobacterales bacterium]|nr:TIGR03984 family CRISPR-associated protein [Desulfobacterales bacterium]
MEENGLKLRTLHTEVEKAVEIKAGEINPVIAGYMDQEAHAVVWQDHKVLIGTYDEKESRLLFYKDEEYEPGHVLRMRIFDPEKELMIWRTPGGFKRRFRKDDLSGQGAHVVEARQVLIGTRFEKLPDSGYTRIWEDRGSELYLPFDNIEVDSNRRRAFIKTYNYIGYNKAHQATYEDGRFVGFGVLGG